MILVVGATGLLGNEICQRLRQAGRQVRAVVRPGSNPERTRALESAGAETVLADLKDPDSLRAACRNTTALISTASSTLSRQAGDSIESVDSAGHLRLIEAARQAGIGRFIYTSIPRTFRYDSPLTRAKRQIEAALVASGLAYTVLLANYFMEVWLSPALGFDYPNGRVILYGSGEQPLAWVSYRDVAATAVAALDQESARNRALTVGGPGNLAPNEVVDIFEAAAGRKFRITRVPQDELERQYAEAADPLQRSFAALMLEYARGCPMDLGPALQGLPGPSVSVADCALRSVR